MTAGLRAQDLWRSGDGPRQRGRVATEEEEPETTGSGCHTEDEAGLWKRSSQVLLSDVLLHKYCKLEQLPPTSHLTHPLSLTVCVWLAPLTGRQLLSALRCILSMFSIGRNRRMWLSTPRNAFMPSNSWRKPHTTLDHSSCTHKIRSDQLRSFLTVHTFRHHPSFTTGRDGAGAKLPKQPETGDVPRPDGFMHVKLFLAALQVRRVLPGRAACKQTLLHLEVLSQRSVTARVGQRLEKLLEARCGTKQQLRFPEYHLLLSFAHMGDVAERAACVIGAKLQPRSFSGTFRLNFEAHHLIMHV